MNEERKNDSVPGAPTVDEMTEALEQYYEAAGWADVKNRVLKNKSVKEIRRTYINVFCKEENDNEE